MKFPNQNDDARAGTLYLLCPAGSTEEDEDLKNI
jgi:hypothetical protein